MARSNNDRHRSRKQPMDVPRIIFTLVSWSILCGLSITRIQQEALIIVPFFAETTAITDTTAPISPGCRLLPVPHSKADAYEFGRLSVQLDHAINTNDTDQADTIAAAMAQVLLLSHTAAEECSSTQIVALLTNNQQHEEEEITTTTRSTAHWDEEEEADNKGMRLFTIVNVVWTIAMLGITATMGPALVQMAKLTNLHVLFYKLQQHGVIRVGLWLVATCTSMSAAALEERQNPVAYRYALLALALATVAQFFDEIVNGMRRTPPPSSSQEPTVTAFDYTMWLVMSAVPMAIHHQSTLIGYIAMMGIYHLLGHAIKFGPLSISLGFEDRNVCVRCARSSAVILLGSITLHGLGLAHAKWYAPFHPACIMIGVYVYFLALVILASPFFSTSKQVVYKVNAAFFISVFVAYATFTLFNQAALLNVPTIFLVLHAFDCFIYVQMCSNNTCTWVIGLQFFVGLFVCAHLMHQYPEAVVGMLP